MDEIIYLEPDEEITSVIDKIKNTSQRRLGLVLPREASLLQSVVNLRLLQREAGALNKEIAIVTTDRIGRNLAAQIGLPVYNSIEEQKPIFTPQAPKPDTTEVIEVDMAPAKEEEKVPGVSVHHFQERPVDWRAKKPPMLKPTKNIIESDLKTMGTAPAIRNIVAHKEKDAFKFRKLIWPIAAVVFVLLLIGTFLLLPRATVTVHVPSEDLQKKMPIIVSSGVKTSSIDQGVIPGELIEVPNDKKETFQTTGKKTIGEKAKGTINIYNNLDSNGHPFKAGTKLSSSSKTFITLSDVTVPGAGVQSGKVVPGTVSVDIEAENPGADYNVKAGRFTILNLPAAQQDALYGQSSKDMSGGLSKEVQVVSTDDFNNAKNKIIGELAEATKAQLIEKTKDKKVLDKAIVVPDPEVTSTANVGQEAKSFEMTVKYRQQVMIFDFAALKAMLLAKLEKDAPADKVIAIASDNDIVLGVDKTVYDKGELDLGSDVLAKIAPKIDAGKIKAEIVGKKFGTAEGMIKAIPGVTKVDFDIWPTLWLKRLPDLSGNITVNIKYEAK